MMFFDVRVKSIYWDKIVPEPNSGCWLWIACTSKNGYGKMAWRERGRKYYAYSHRFIYEHLVKIVPKGFELDHKCENTICCNPDHLQIVTHLVNMRRWIVGKKEADNINLCPSGHEFNEENTRFEPDGGRRCRKCIAIKQLALYHKDPKKYKGLK